MGEALITRRGGSVKTGMVADVQAFVMSDSAFVGAKNGLVVLCNESPIGEPVTYKLATVLFIEDGAITSYAYLRGGIRYRMTNYKPEIDITTGTITCPDTNYGSDRVSFKGMYSSSTVYGEYRYFLWD